jgi:hypothetical protein
MKQACVWIDDWSDSQPGFLKGVDSNGDAKPHCPVEDNVINLSRNACQTCVESFVRDLPQFRNGRPVWPAFVEAANKTGLNLTTIGDTVEARTPTLVNQLIIFCTMHELGHALGGRHHGLDEYLAAPVHSDAENSELQTKFYGGGVPTCPMRYWHYAKDQSEVVRFLAGQWDLMTASDGTDWRFCPDDQPNFRIKPYRSASMTRSQTGCSASILCRRSSITSGVPSMACVRYFCAGGGNSVIDLPCPFLSVVHLT